MGRAQVVWFYDDVMVRAWLLPDGGVRETREKRGGEVYLVRRLEGEQEAAYRGIVANRGGRVLGTSCSGPTVKECALEAKAALEAGAVAEAAEWLEHLLEVYR